MAIYSEQVLDHLCHDVPFAWYLRDQAAQSPLFRLTDLKTLDERLNGYLRMITLAETDGHKPLESLDEEEDGYLFVCMWLGIIHQQEEIWQAAAELATTEAQSDELASALAWFPPEALHDVLMKLGFSNNPWLRRATLKYAQLRQVRLADVYLQEKITGTDEPEVLMALENLAAQSHETRCDLPQIRLNSSAIELATLKVAYCHQTWDNDTLVAQLLPLMKTDTDNLRELLPLIFSLASPEQVSGWLQQLLSAQISERLKLYAIGIAGLPQFIPRLIESMTEPEWAPLAAEALAFITGIDPEEDDLSLIHLELEDREKQKQLDELQEETWHQRYQRDNQTQPYEPELPYPDIAQIQQWWQKNQSNWQPEQRYLAGQRCDESGLRQVFISGNQQQRALAALYLKRLCPDQPMPNVTAPAWIQQV
ncbi:hypothetical protein [Vibrio quintilis]|uniref:TIGR02270 family protein n=1 Tax=Vibrio quintilis TaxID=1117707 RepID=A0A1M7YW93_9VIBR|nr:hypothetical protein [Vibrio quintilis]SHO56852.1 hypothetical protein VQ7734_02621 [Vibrio quintilis]